MAERSVRESSLGPDQAQGRSWHETLVRDRWFILAILFIARTAIAFQFQCIAALGPLLVQDLAMDYARLGTLVGLYMLPGIVVAIPGGLLGQRFGDKRVALLGLALMVLGGAWIGLGGSYTSAAAGRLVSGVGAVLLNILLAKMIADWFAGREIVTAMALFLSSWPIGIGLALVLLPVVAAAASIAISLSVAAVVSSVALVLMLAFYRAPPDHVAAPASLRFSLSRPEWVLSILSGMVWTLFNVGYILVLAFGPSFLTARGLSVGTAGATVSLVTWTILLSLPLGGYLAERLKWPDGLMVGCFLALAGVILALPFGLHSAVAFAAIGLLAGPPAGLIMKLPTEVLRPENRAAGMGVYYTCYYGGMAGLVPVAGLLRDATQSPSAPLLFAAGLVLGAAGSLVGFRTLQARTAVPGCVGGP